MNYKTHEIVAVIEEMVSTTGQEPSYQTIRDKLGSGSFATIKKALDAYRQKHAPVSKLSTATNLPDKLLNRVGKMANDIWLDALAQAQAGWAQEREALTQQLQALQRKYDALCNENDIRDVIADHVFHDDPAAPEAKAYAQLEAKVLIKTELTRKAAIKIKQLMAEVTQLSSELDQTKAALADATRAPEATPV
ncbi:DNA-binding protein [Comamonas sp. C11]|nr:DNA-binding protein [Comamonas sp. C11]UUC91577.1 DNA-binding protein [Comamonas sp. C11]